QYLSRDFKVNRAVATPYLSLGCPDGTFPGAVVTAETSTHCDVWLDGVSVMSNVGPASASHAEISNVTLPEIAPGNHNITIGYYRDSPEQNNYGVTMMLRANSATGANVVDANGGDVSTNQATYWRTPSVAQTAWTDKNYAIAPSAWLSAPKTVTGTTAQT